MSVACSTSGPRRLLLVQALDDHALVGVKLRPDPFPQRLDVVVDRGGAADHLEQCGDADLDHT